MSRADRTAGEIDWPAGFERTPPAERKRSSKFRVSMDQALNDIEAELLDRLDADDWRISTAAPNRKKDGRPYADANPDDTGAVIRWSKETEQLPILDPRSLTNEERNQIRSALDELMAREVELGEDVSIEETESQRDTLDRAVLEPLGMVNRLDELKSGVDHMVKMREQAAGEATDVLVSRPEEKEVIELEGVTSARESTTLGDFG